jgi:tetratricopeptide (TPR) repeat protein
MLQSVLGDDASLEPLTQRLIERTQRNPFFLEESIRTLVETQVLVGEPGAYRLAKTLPSIQVPATVQAVLAARIDRLPPAEKELLQTAAVIGTEVPLALLETMAEAPEEPLRLGLTHLQAAEFLYETRLFPEIEYTFKHALTQQVAYETLLQERRRALHARIVEALEALAGDRVAEQVERLTHHALRGELWEKALRYCRQAGAKAVTRSAFREAVAFYEQALEALQHLPERRDTREQAIDLRMAIGAALWPLGNYEQRFEYLRQAETLAEGIDDKLRLGRLCSAMIHHFRLMGDEDRLIEYGQRALAVARAVGDFALEVHTTQLLGRAYFDMADYQQAIRVLRKNVAALEGDWSREQFGTVGLVSVLSRTWLALSLAECGEFTEGIAHGEEAVRIAKAVDEPYSLLQADLGVGTLYLTQGDLPNAIRTLERDLELYHIWDLPLLFPWITSHLGYAYALAGRVGEALPLLEQAMNQATSLRSNSFPRWVAWLSEACLLAGRLEDALQIAGRAVELPHTHIGRAHQARALRVLGDMAAQRNPPNAEGAEGHYRGALALAVELGMRPLQAHCHLGLGTLYAKVGQREQARAELSAAIKLYRAMDMTFWLPQAEAALAKAG